MPIAKSVKEKIQTAKKDHKNKILSQVGSTTYCIICEVESSCLSHISSHPLVLSFHLITRMGGFYSCNVVNFAYYFALNSGRTVESPSPTELTDLLWTSFGGGSSGIFVKVEETHTSRVDRRFIGFVMYTKFFWIARTWCWNLIIAKKKRVTKSD